MHKNTQVLHAYKLSHYCCEKIPHKNLPTISELIIVPNQKRVPTIGSHMKEEIKKSPSIDIISIAKLAMIDIEEKNQDTLQKECEKIVDYIAFLGTCKSTEDASVWWHPQYIKMTLRSDDKTSCMPQNEVLENAPETLENKYIKVPSVIDH